MSAWDTRLRRVSGGLYWPRGTKSVPSDKPFGALLLAHGAGAGQSSPFMVRVATGLAERGLSTATFDFAYMAAGREVPDRAPALEGAWRDAMATGRSRFGGLPLYIGGKSMGGRIASHVAAQAGSGPLAGLVFLGYPLHPPGRPEQRRDAHLPAIPEPMLFVQGSRDAFGSGTEIRDLLPSLQSAPSRRSRAAITRSKFQVELRDRNRCCRASWTRSQRGHDATPHAARERRTWHA